MKTHYKPQLLLPLEHEATHSGLFQAFLPFSGCTELRPFQDLLLQKTLVFIAVEMYSGRHLSASRWPLETALAAILQAWSGKTGKGDFTVRE